MLYIIFWMALDRNDITLDKLSRASHPELEHLVKNRWRRLKHRWWILWGAKLREARSRKISPSEIWLIIGEILRNLCHRCIIKRSFEQVFRAVLEMNVNSLFVHKEAIFLCTGFLWNALNEMLRGMGTVSEFRVDFWVN